MRIAMIGQKGIPAAMGGVERHVEEISRRLVERGHDVTVYCRSTYREDRPPAFQGVRLKYIKTLDSKNLEAIIYSFKSSLGALCEKYDIIHYHALGPTSLSFIPRACGRKVVATIHGLDWQRDKWGRAAKSYLKFGEWASACFPAKIISVSANLREYYLDRYKKRPDDVVFIPNGVEVRPPAEPREITKLGLDRNGYLLFLARIVPEKGAHYLIEAYKRLDTTKKLVIAGGSSHTEDYYESLKHSAAGHEGIIFTGVVQGRMLEELYSNAYVYVLPSDIEGMPLTLLEAMSYARCCLTSDIPENQGVIQDRLGFTFARSDVDDLSEKLTHILQQPELVKTIGVAAFNEIQEKYNWDKVTDQTLKVYDALD